MPIPHDTAPDRLVSEPGAQAPMPTSVVPARALLRLADAVQRKGLLQPIAAESAAAGSRLPSPCINVCTMGQVMAEPIEPLCQGCLRTLPEIMEWGGAVSSRQQAIWRDVLQRLQMLQQH
ncbi:DUF1289 domain-containing protein [Lampropedia aestuarii]|nr:DUF1289 domain-containing protein [Lampropedia aestuarii]MDH5858259.1 DUF1289 domain-containing protein [Lampropedia aestuarii]